MAFPEHRPRRLRRTAALRELSRETRVVPSDLVDALFVVEGSGVREPIGAMPGISRLSVDQLADEAKRIEDLGLGGVMLFGIPARKDALGTGAYDPDGVVARAIGAMKRAAPELIVIADVCLCEYTDHGHCGVYEDGAVRNDLLAARAPRWSRPGRRRHQAPSDDGGRVAAIRRVLDQRARGTVILLRRSMRRRSRPFQRPPSRPKSGDRRGYQMDSAMRARRWPSWRPIWPRARTSDGEAGHALPRHRAGGARALLDAALRLSGERRVQHAAGGDRARLARRAARDRREPARDPARRRRPDHHVLREGLRAAPPWLSGSSTR
jgi:hypothetical protein